MTDKEMKNAQELVDSVTQYYKSTNMSISDATSEAISMYKSVNIAYNSDAMKLLNEYNKDWDEWSRNIVKAFDMSGIAQSISMVDKQMNSIRDALTIMFENYDLSAYKRLAESLQKVMERHFDDSNEHPEDSTVIEDTFHTSDDVSNDDNALPLFKMFAGYLSANYGQQFTPSSDRSKIVIMFLFIFFSQIGTNLLNTSIEKTVFPDKEEQSNPGTSYSNFTKEQIDRALDLEERKVKILENEQKKDSE